VAINTDGTSPHASAMLDIKATDRGLLIPRLSSGQRNALPSPSAGLLIYNSTTDSSIGLFGNTYILRWIISNGCISTVDDVTIGFSSWSCGLSYTVNHVVGNVAPVNKTVTYGTVTNEEEFLYPYCWITRNLGASQQATAANDATEASAGWYWQFNRKQGYKHDFTTRTPNSTWKTNINESSNWTAANDPCTILLGSGWRIPSYDE